jgi:hypothetical protein
MGRWLLVCALVAPAATQAAPVAPTERPIQTTYLVTAPAGHGHLPAGWGLYATMHGRSTELSSPRFDWADDPSVQPRDIEAGYGWRGGRASALIGYDQHDYGPKLQRALSAHERDPNEPPPVTSSGVLGFSFVLHGR